MNLGHLDHFKLQTSNDYFESNTLCMDLCLPLRSHSIDNQYFISFTSIIPVWNYIQIDTFDINVITNCKLKLKYWTLPNEILVLLKSPRKVQCLSLFHLCFLLSCEKYSTWSHFKVELESPSKKTILFFSKKSFHFEFQFFEKKKLQQERFKWKEYHGHSILLNISKVSSNLLQKFFAIFYREALTDSN